MAWWLTIKPCNHVYSALNDFTGFATAAFIAWKLTVNNAIAIAIMPAIANIHQLISIRYAKACNHLFINHQAIGDAIKMAMHTSFTKSFDNNVVIPVTVQPNILRMPISLVRFSASNAVRLNNPNAEMTTAIIANTNIRKGHQPCSLLNFG